MELVLNFRYHFFTYATSGGVGIATSKRQFPTNDPMVGSNPAHGDISVQKVTKISFTGADPLKMP